MCCKGRCKSARFYTQWLLFLPGGDTGMKVQRTYLSLSCCHICNERRKNSWGKSPNQRRSCLDVCFKRDLMLKYWKVRATGEPQTTTKQGFYAVAGLPNAIGAVDCTHGQTYTALTSCLLWAAMAPFLMFIVLCWGEQALPTTFSQISFCVLLYTRQE